jgi:hypothetical protein
VDTLNQLPSAEALWTLRDLGVRFVVSPNVLAVARGGPSPLVERADLAGSIIYELIWTPEVEAALPRPEPPPPPEAGALPFSSSEVAVYRVIWLTGTTAGAAAGRVTLSAMAASTGAGSPPGASDGPIRLAADVETAGWVAAFFEARDRIETWADAALLPLRQEQHLREGRRVVDKVITFDQGRHTVRAGDGPALPLARWARDGLTAFFYTRTLPLAPGFGVRFPVSEGGRAFVLDVRAGDLEPIVLGGRTVEALRITPNLSLAADRRRTIQATIWISNDRRRVPLVLEIGAGFGSFRAELERYDAK